MKHETKGYLALVVITLTAFLALLSWAVTARGQWGTSRGPVGPAVVSVAPDGLRADPADSCRMIEWRGGRPVAVHFADGSVREWDSYRGVWGAWREQVVAAPAPPEPQKNFGLGWSPDPERPERCYLNGIEVDRKRAYEAIGSGVVDDTKLLRVTVIGSEAECKQVRGAFETAPELAPHRNNVILQCYRPDHWAVADAGFKRDGKPVVYVQAPSGKVLHRQDEWRGPAKMAEALRKADPSYDPKKDPDLNKQAPILPVPGPDLDILKKVPAWGWGVLIALGVLGFFWIKERGVAHVR